MSDDVKADSIDLIELAMQDTLKGMVRADIFLSSGELRSPLEEDESAMQLLKNEGKLYYWYVTPKITGCIYYEKSMFHCIMAEGKEISVIRALSLYDLINELHKAS